jgi:AmmeMemoRadiSam system protein A
MEDMLTLAEKRLLLQIAREAVTAAAHGRPAPEINKGALPLILLEPGATFVTLRKHGELRGCIGGLEARWPLYEDVRVHAAQSATQDYRFPPVEPDEVGKLTIEISVLTPSTPLAYDSSAELPARLRPLVDGVTLQWGTRRATFLPQVWENVPDPEQFLSMLCEKMGVAPDTWRQQLLDVQVYQDVKFSETETQ